MSNCTQNEFHTTKSNVLVFVGHREYKAGTDPSVVTTLGKINSTAIIAVCFVPDFEGIARAVCFHNSTTRTPLSSPKSPLRLVSQCSIQQKDRGSSELPVFKWPSSFSFRFTSSQITNAEWDESSQGHAEG